MSITLQQMQYIVAVDQYRHFVQAAEACGVTQSTLSTMIKNLENEMDVIIFDRTAHPVKPTEVGEKIINQAKVVLFHSGQLLEIPEMEKASATGDISIGIIPTIAPYILPKLFEQLKKLSGIRVKAIEARTSVIVDKLQKAEIDMAIAATPLNHSDFLEIPLYYEKFYAYIAQSDTLFDQKEIDPNLLPGDNLWVLQEGHCFRNQIINFCNHNQEHSLVYESGSIDTLIKVVDINGGHTIIPEMHLPFLNEDQRKSVRKISGNEPVREVSLIIRNDYVKERLLNIITDAIKRIVPEEMIDSRLKRFSVKL